MSKAMLLYKDLLTEIEILEIQLRAIEREYKNIYNKSLMVKPRPVSAIDYSSEPTKGGVTQVAAYEALGRVGAVMNRYNELNKELQEKYHLRDEIKEHIEKFEGLEYKIARMRIVGNYSLYEIADELGYSYEYIRKVSSRMDKRSHSGNKKVAKS